MCHRLDTGHGLRDEDHNTDDDIVAGYNHIQTTRHYHHHGNGHLYDNHHYLGNAQTGYRRNTKIWPGPGHADYW